MSAEIIILHFGKVGENYSSFQSVKALTYRFLGQMTLKSSQCDLHERSSGPSSNLTCRQYKKQENSIFFS